ncbi:MAG: T9SS type A sorting domain-containing protein [Cryomorphaceae bacterium]|nr:T9SS type A sorting domain-containing protein [Cryomorphaceae bacterium]
MKKILLFTTTVFSFSAFAQITVPHDHFDVPISPDTAFSVSFIPGSNPIPLPTHGAQQNWDYSDFSPQGTIFNSYLPYDNNPNFPNATGMNFYNPMLGSLQIMGSRSYVIKDNNGFYNNGFETMENSYGIGSMSGNPGDTLYMLNSFNNYGLNSSYIEYPIDENSSWSSTVIADTDFELTVAAFMLNRTPGIIRQYTTREDDVMGWGLLTVGTTSINQYPSLLVRETVTFVDSFFLGGQPAPEALLLAFGLNQGETVQTHRYYFVTYDPIAAKNRTTALSLNLNQNGTEVTSGSYHDAHYNTISIDKFAKKMQPKLYPNPVSEEGRFNVSFNQPLENNLTVEIISMGGAVVNATRLNAGASEYELNLNRSAAGYYTLRFVDDKGEVVYIDKVLKKN